MAGVFISYRRKDAAAYARGLHDAISRAFGHDRVFMDIRDLERGLDFARSLDAAVTSADVLLAVIGPQWLTLPDTTGNRRLDDPEDWVRQEIAAALVRDDIRVIPVLVGNAAMPRTGDLPDDLKALAHRHAIELTDERWDYDVGVLVDDLKRVVQAARGVRMDWIRRPQGLAATAGALLLVVAVALGLNGVLGDERSEPWDDICRSGYVFRGAFPGDEVCVEPSQRDQAAADNAAAVSRIDPNGPYGPFSCVQGYVWRVARPSDLVCVEPEVRDQVAADNDAAPSRER